MKKMSEKTKQIMNIALIIPLVLILVWLSLSLFNMLTGNGFSWTGNKSSNQQQENPADEDPQLGGSNPRDD